MATRLLAALVAAVLVVLGTAPEPARASHPVATPTVVQSGLVIPWDVGFAPDGTMFVTERPGRIRVYASGMADAQLVSTTEVRDVRSEHESGLNGLAVDIDFASNRFIYVCASRDPDGATGPAPWVNEVIRYRVTPQRALVEPAVIFTGAKAAFQHNGCSLVMDSTGRLWIGIGDAREPSLAQDPTSLNGKILRIERDGSTPTDNPVMPGADVRTAVYSMGHRNPQGIGFDPANGQAYAAEHGPNTDDEINRIEPGANYGWPCYTGFGRPFQTSGCGPATDYANPVWSSGDVTIATSGMTFLNHPTWGGWNGTPVVSQLKEQDLRRFVPGGTGLQQADLLFDMQFGRLRAAVMAPDGALYLTTSNGSNDRVIRVVPGGVVVDRYAGADRYATAAVISSQTFPVGTPVVYVATGLDYPDALAGGGAAARNRSPVLLVTRTGIPSATASELRRLAPQRIMVLGGEGAIAESVRVALSGYAPGGAQRLFGADRYATAAAISKDTFAPGVPVAYIATGTNYPDALAGVPAAGVEGGPILLVRQNDVPSATANELSRVKPQRIVILGGTGAVSSGVAAVLQQYSATIVQRRAGADRYATAVATSQGAFGPRVPRVFIATGRDYPDGLTGGPAGAFHRGPLLLVPGTQLPSVVRQELLRLDPDRVTILGGTGAVTETVRAQIDALLNP